MTPQKVYLAGGFKSDWQEIVKTRLYSTGSGSYFIWLDPKCKEYINGERLTMDVFEYGQWDLHFIRLSDIVFVYVERDNPGCIGLACEAGYAKGLGKTVILVLEPGHLTIHDRYLLFLTQVSDIVFDDLDKGIAYLKSFAI